MTPAIADIFIDKLTSNGGLPFIDKIAGVVRPVIKLDVGEGGKQIKKVFPVACNVTHTECLSGKLMDLVPNQKYKSLIFFEDLGTTPTGEDRKFFEFRTRLKMIMWFNLAKLGKTACSVDYLAIAAVLKKLPTGTFNYNTTFSRVNITLVGVDPKSSAIFSKYSFDEATTQYLLYPFDYCATTWEVTYTIPHQCIDDWTNSTAITCVDNGNT
jgi:hypothetical protein